MEIRQTFSVILSLISALIFETQIHAQRSEKDWWKTTTIYQIYPRSFKDSNGDGVGDINGIYEKLDYIKDMGIETIWIQPFYRSPMADLGYDVSDFREIDPIFGTMEHFKRLLKEIHSREMKLLLDMVPNHVSDESEWFKKSIEREEPYTDFFVWQNMNGTDDDGKPIPPNNWRSVFGGSAWQWNAERRQFYLRQFSARQPDLNFRNPNVREAFKEVMRFWLDLGVDGFRIDAVMFLVEAAHLEDEPFYSLSKQSHSLGDSYPYPYPYPSPYGEDEYSKMNHIYTINQPETYEITHEWRVFLDEYSSKNNKTIIMCSEAYTDMGHLMKYFGNDTHRSVHFPFYFGLVGINYQTSAVKMNELVHAFTDSMPPHGVANWVMSNHDNSRVASRLGRMFVDGMNMVCLLLPGVASVYYGDELGMEDAPVRWDQRQDPNNGGGGRTDLRDAYRAPMQWDDSTNSGFTINSRPWLPLHPDYVYKNVAAQLKESESHLKIFKRLMELRKSPIIKDGELDTCPLSKWVFMYVRKLEGHPLVLVVVNMGSETESVCAKICSDYLPDVMKVHTASVNSGYRIGDDFNVVYSRSTFCSRLRPKAGVVLTDSGSISSAPYSLSFSSSLVSCTMIVLAALNF
ncbi:maltase A3 [Bemisia tabaci]|uniref:maltase A3 n=1 Tax=Bemisia tabaci TaxID=7038 RepID=UPI003B288104